MRAKQILIVESHAARRQLLGAQVGDLGQGEVVEVATGPEALSLIVREPVALIVLDMQLLGLEGWEVVRRIRALPAPERDTPILGFTAHARHDDEQKVMAAGCDDYIAKPETERSLLKTKVEQLLAQGRLLRS
jgi:two-component system cell cycle response regulator DivK